ncbi:ComEC family protein [Enterobacteriaceae bacterium 89]|nr:ComEC family protein [Enterobacteriaceae bacterium 89]
MRLPILAICVILGATPLLWLPQLPPPVLTGLTALVGAALCAKKGLSRLAGLILLSFCWSILCAWLVIQPTRTLAGKPLVAEVVVTAAGGENRLIARLTRINGLRQFPAPGVAFYGQQLPVNPCAGQKWRMTLKARPVHGQLNEGIFDSQRHAVSQHLPLTGRIVQAQLLEGRCSLRSRIVASVQQSLAAYRWGSVMLALAVGEKSAVPAELKLLLQRTGTAHLLAISGLHVSLVALLGWFILRVLQGLLPCRWINWRAPLLGGLLLAMIYAWLSGFQPPAQRTLMAACCWLALRLLGRRWTPLEVWLCCVAAIIVIDPLAILSQSLWLSAFAVLTLIFWYQWGPTWRHVVGFWLRNLYGLVHLQLGLMLLLLPMQVAVFHGMAWMSVPANLIAVPVVTLMELPLLLAGLLLHFCGPVVLEDGIWLLADRVLALLFWLLERMPEGWAELDQRWQWLAFLPWLGILFWRFHLWRSSPGLTITCCALLAQPFWHYPPDRRWSVTMLDVGQGLAMVIARNGKALLYDTGLAWPGGDTGQQLIVPWLRWHHLQPEGIILSHEHLDHRGGLETLQRVWPGLWVRSPLPWKGHQPCFRGESWQWQGLRFQAHWPLPGTKETGNNRSCVVSVDDGHHSVLLTGDIETPAEMSMLSHYWQHLRSTLVQVPHHGSSTSSSVALLRQVGGQIALASAARYNAWHLPSIKVKARYQQQNYQWLDTPHQGQVTVTFSTEDWQIQSLRDQIFPRWYHQWFGDTQDNG